MVHALAALLFSGLAFDPSGAVSAPPRMADVFVDASGNCSLGTGSAGSPVCTIASALALAASGDTIRIAPGIYVENVVIDFDLELIGTGGAAVTTIDGGSQGSVVTIPAAVTVRLEGLTLTNGLALEGGGIDCSGVLTLVNSTVRMNTATGLIGGGGIGSPYGGADLTIEGCTIERNSATQGNGGGIDSRGGPLTITNSVLRLNSAYDYGGGIFFDDAFTGSTLRVTETTIEANDVIDGYGGGIEILRGTMLLTNSTLSGNVASIGGGGLESFRGSFDIRNVTISGNTSGYGGGISVFGAFAPAPLDLSLSHVTLVNNECLTITGGGVQNWSSYSMEVSNTIVAENRVPVGQEFGRDLSGMFTGLGHNLIGSGAFGFADGVNNDLVGSTDAPLDPGLASLTSFAGKPAVHALLPASPALDSGDPTNFEALDQLGRMRPRGSAPDIGAVEGGPGFDLCNGDGGDSAGCTPCPCGNDAPASTIGGCLNSAGTSMRLLRFGTSSVSQPELRFEGTGAPPLSTALLISSTTAAPANPANPCFGLDSGVQSLTLDGLRCVVVGTSRHGARAIDVNGSTVTGWGQSDNFIGFLAFVTGETRGFQLIYRDDPALVCQTALNTSQASRVTFVP